MKDFALLYVLGKISGQTMANQRQMAQIIQTQNAQQEEENQQKLLRNELASQTQILNRSIDETPHIALWNSLNYEDRIERFGISQESFIELTDKERFIESLELARALYNKSADSLSSEEVLKIKAGIAGRSAAPLIRSAVIWKTILNKMTPNIPFIQGLIWNGKKTVGFIFLVACFILMASTGFWQLFVAAIPLMWIATLVRSAKAKRLNILAESVGGFFTKTARPANIQAIVRSFEAELEAKGIPAGRLSVDELYSSYEREIGKTYTANEDFQIGLNLSEHPRQLERI